MCTIIYKDFDNQESLYIIIIICYSMNCRFCNNYMSGLDRCKFCNFDANEDYDFFTSNDEWDILNLKEEDGWEHIQILDRLRLNGVECIAADIWFNENMALLFGCKGDHSEVARLLGVSEKVFYVDYDKDLILINLFQEKFLRGYYDEKNE